MGAESNLTNDLAPELTPELAGWITDVTGATRLVVQRRTGGASRAGFTVDAVLPHGTTDKLWLRMELGSGPQSGTLYSVRREAAVYRALGSTPMRVAELIAVHPHEPAFLMRRISGGSRFAAIADPETQRAIARQFIDQLVTLHRIDPSELDLPELGPVGALADHIAAEITEWEAQYEATGASVPTIAVALAWMRAHVPADDDQPVVLVQGDTGPGNFMFDGDVLTAITDWELAHWGDAHDDLAWLLVRNNQERIPNLADQLRAYAIAAGRPIDATRLRYFRVFAQTRCAIGTLAGLSLRDPRGEVAWQLTYNTLHTRLLAELIADAMGVLIEPMPPVDAAAGVHTWLFDVALGDLRDLVVPAISDDFAGTRAKGVARLLKYLREVDRLGPDLTAAELDDISAVLGHSIHNVEVGRHALCVALTNGALTADEVVPYCLRQAARDTAVARPAMGDLANRHFDAITDLLPALPEERKL